MNVYPGFITHRLFNGGGAIQIAHHCCFLINNIWHINQGFYQSHYLYPLWYPVIPPFFLFWSLSLLSLKSILNHWSNPNFCWSNPYFPGNQNPNFCWWNPKFCWWNPNFCWSSTSVSNGHRSPWFAPWGPTTSIWPVMPLVAADHWQQAGGFINYAAADVWKIQKLGFHGIRMRTWIFTQIIFVV